MIGQMFPEVVDFVDLPCLLNVVIYLSYLRGSLHIMHGFTVSHLDPLVLRYLMFRQKVTTRLFEDIARNDER